jgi:hypothetical protein
LNIGIGGPGADGSLWQNGYNPKSNYANSLLDQPISFNGDLIYDLPVGKGRLLLNQGGVADAVLGGWRLSGIWQIHSGNPFSVYIPNNLSGSLAGVWFPNRTASGKLSNPTIQKWFDPTAFVQRSYGTYGNAGRDVLFGPAWRQLDLSVQKHWALKVLGDVSDLQVRIDANDVLNHPNFSNPNSALHQSNTGTITGANTSRGVQFEAKFSFLANGGRCGVSITRTATSHFQQTQPSCQQQGCARLLHDCELVTMKEGLDESARVSRKCRIGRRCGASVENVRQCSGVECWKRS